MNNHPPFGDTSIDDAVVYLVSTSEMDFQEAEKRHGGKNLYAAQRLRERAVNGVIGIWGRRKIDGAFAAGSGQFDPIFTRVEPENLRRAHDSARGILMTAKHSSEPSIYTVFELSDYGELRVCIEQIRRQWPPMPLWRRAWCFLRSRVGGVYAET